MTDGFALNVPAVPAVLISQDMTSQRKVQQRCAFTLIGLPVEWFTQVRDPHWDERVQVLILSLEDARTDQRGG